MDAQLEQMLRIADAAGIDRQTIVGTAYRTLLAELVAKGYVVEGQTMDEVEAVAAKPPTRPPKEDEGEGNDKDKD